MLGDQFAVVVGVAEGELGPLLAAVEQLDLVVLGEADTTVDLLAVGDHSTSGLRAPGLRHVDGDGGLGGGLAGRDGPGSLVHDEAGAIGRRYRRQDEAGTPFGVTIDFDTLGEKPELKDTVTLRDRDTMQQHRIAITELLPFLLSKIR